MKKKHFQIYGKCLWEAKRDLEVEKGQQPGGTPMPEQGTPQYDLWVEDLLENRGKGKQAKQINKNVKYT